MTIKYFVKFLIIFLVLSCHKENKKNYILIYGEIIGETIDTIYIEKDGYTQPFIKYPIPISKNQTFIDTLNLTYGYYKLSYGNNSVGLYLEPNFKLNLKLDLQEDNIKYDGIGKKENNYLFEKIKLKNKTGKIDNYQHYASLNEKQFLKTNDSISKLYLNLLSKSEIQNDKFEDLEKKSIQISNDYNLMSYEVEKRLLTTEKKFKVSNSFPKPVKLIDFNDESLLKIPSFIPLLINSEYYFLNETHNFDTSTEVLKCVDCDISFESLKYMGSNLKNEKMRNAATFLIAKWMLIKSENVDTFYDLFESLNTNIESKNYIHKLYKNLKTNKDEAYLMKTLLKDVSNKYFTLKDFKGKYLYLDFWSSSCKPCIKEFQNFNNLSTKFKDQNILFIGINMWDTEKRWLETIQKNSLLGIQLTVEKNTSYLDSIGISGIPRYMLINDIGNVIDYNAKSPSDIHTMTFFSNFLSK